MILLIKMKIYCKHTMDSEKLINASEAGVWYLIVIVTHPTMI